MYTYIYSYMYINSKIFFIYSYTDRQLGWFHILAIVYSTALHMGVQMSLQHTDFILYTAELSKLLDHMVVLFLIFKLFLNATCFPSFKL
jgi:hypothetical protein